MAEPAYDPPMRVAVTGAGGFIGSEVVSFLSKRPGMQVLPLLHPKESAHRLAGTPFHQTIERIDLSEPRLVADFFKRTTPLALIHLAWAVPPTDYLSSTENLVSLSMTTSVIKAALDAGCQKVVLAGTCLEYADSAVLRVETAPVAPQSLYATCKQAAFTVCSNLAQGAGASLAAARIFHLHGPKEHPDRLLPWITNRLANNLPTDLTDGTQIRDHLHVQDVAAGLATLLKPEASGIFNICSGQPVSLLQILSSIGDAMGKTDLLRFGVRPQRPGEIAFLAGDSTKLTNLGWSPTFSLTAGLIDAVRPFSKGLIS